MIVLDASATVDWLIPNDASKTLVASPRKA
jgi:predicted nucleic acid-binding protein